MMVNLSLAEINMLIEALRISAEDGSINLTDDPMFERTYERLRHKLIGKMLNDKVEWDSVK